MNDILNPGTITVVGYSATVASRPDEESEWSVTVLEPVELKMWYSGTSYYDFKKIWGKPRVKAEKLRAVMRKAKSK